MDVNDEFVLLFGSIFIYLILKKRINNRRYRRFRVHPYLMERNTKGRFKTAVSDACVVIVFLLTTMFYLFCIPVRRSLVQ